ADVPASEYRGLMAAESKGSYFLANIRDCYPYAPLNGPRRR
ncbi:MAG TPA: KTSC domain-containing protein, partial [Armatimonadota bacterium]|nr:KTSC domain-containing protein [Armatimonadota bacterium]